MSMDLIVLYSLPTDLEHFNEHFHRVHVPLVRTMPHVLEFEVSTGPVDVSIGPDIFLVARLRYATQAAVDASLASPEGQAAVADLANFAEAGVVVITADMGSAVG